MSTPMQANSLRQLASLDQSVWPDDIRRGSLKDNTLAWLIGEHGLAGVTSNRAIIAKAIGGDAEYEGAIRELASKGAPDVSGHRGRRRVCQSGSLPPPGR